MSGIGRQTHWDWRLGASLFARKGRAAGTGTGPQADRPAVTDASQNVAAARAGDAGNDREPVIRVENLCKSFDGAVVLDHVSLSICAAEKVCLIGRSGCGKTVLAKHFNGLLVGDSGSVRVYGVDIGQATEDEIYDIRRKTGYVFQGNALLASLDVYQNVSLSLRDDPYEMPAWNEPEIQQRVTHVLADVGLGPELLHRMPGDLSGGQKKRVAVARAMVSKPPIIIYDEPTTGLDPESSQIIVDLIDNLYQQNNNTTIAISHETKLMKKLGRVVFLVDGRIHFDGSYAAFAASDDPHIRGFLAEGKHPPSDRPTGPP